MEQRERSEHRQQKRTARALRQQLRDAKGKDDLVAIIESQTPDVSEGYHILAIEFVELVEGTAYNQPDVPETRVKMQLRVETPDEPEERFDAYMSQNLSDKATLGSIIRAALNVKNVDRLFDTDELIGKKFGSMVQINDNGWPKLVSGTAASVKAGRSKKSTAPVEEPALLDAGSEPPF